MWNRNLILPALACALAVLPVPAHAQFKELVPAELQMQSDPQWPGADALATPRDGDAGERFWVGSVVSSITATSGDRSDRETKVASIIPDSACPCQSCDRPTNLGRHAVPPLVRCSDSPVAGMTSGAAE